MRGNKKLFVKMICKIVIGIVISLYITVAYIPEYEAYECENKIYAVGDLSINGLIDNYDTLVTTEDNAYVEVDLGEKTYIDKIQINYKNCYKKRCKIQVFWAKNNESYTNKNSTIIYSENVDGYIEVHIDDDVQDLSISIGDKKGEYFGIESIVVNPNSDLFLISVVPHILWVFIIFLLLVLVEKLCIYIWRKLDEGKNKIFVNELVENSIFRNIVLMITCVLLAVIYNKIFIQPYNTNNELANITLDVKKCEKEGIKQNGNLLLTTSEDPKLIADIEELFIEDIAIRVSENDFTWDAQVFYTFNDRQEFSEELSVTHRVFEGERDIIIPINSEVSKLRIDLGNAKGKEYNIISLTLNPEGRLMIYSLPQWLIVILTASFIYILAFIVFFWCNQINRNNKYNCKKQVTISLFVIYILCITAVTLCTNKYDKRNLWDCSLIKTMRYDENDIDDKDLDSIVIGNDPYVIFKAEKDDYKQGLIRFNGISESEEKIGIYYSCSADEFSESRKSIVIKKVGVDYVVFDIPRDNELSFLRIDYEGNNGELVGNSFQVDNVYLTKDTVLNYVTPYIILRIILVTLLFCVLIVIFKVIYDSLGKYTIYIKCKEIASILLLISLPVILFWKYIIGKEYFLFLDIGTDSFYQTFPFLVHMADRISGGQWTEVFSFNYGLGNQEDAIVPNLVNWIAFWGRDYISYLMGISIFLKVVIAGILIYILSTLWGIKDEKRIILAFGYEFNAMLTIRSSWEYYPNLAVMIALWLVLFEFHYIKRNIKTFLLFGICTELFFIQFSIYYVFLYGVIFFVYIIIRFLAAEKFDYVRLCYSALGYCVFAFFGSADIIEAQLLSTIGSNRFSKGKEDFIDTVSNNLRVDFGTLYEAFIRTIGQTIDGISDCQIYSNYNMLEGPSFYCGILIILLLPVAVYNLEKRKRILMEIGLVGSFLYISIRLIRIFAAGFAGDTFKTSSFWIVILWLLILLEAFLQIKKDGYRKNSLLVFNSSSIVVILLIISLIFTGRIIIQEQWWYSLIYVISYVILVNLYFIYHIEIIRIIFCMLIVTEGTVLSYNVINNRSSVNKERLQELYYNESYLAYKDIEHEDSGWYRIEKNPNSVYLCDSLVQGYYGSESYIGGTEIGEGVQSYYTCVNLPYSDMHNLYGTAGNIYANALLGVKYIILKDVDNNRYGVILEKQEGDVMVYKNELALPLVYIYDESIAESDFVKLSTYDRNRIMLEKCVIESQEKLDIKQEKNKFSGQSFNYKSCSNKHINVYEINKGVLVLDLDFNDDCGGVGTLYWKDVDGNPSSQIISYNGVIELCNSDISELWFDETTTTLLDQVNIYTYEADGYYENTVEAIKKLQRNSMDISEVTDYEIKGEVNVLNDGILATSIPYNSKWDIYVDGQKSQLLKVNTGFVGTYISQGNHKVSILFRHNSWIYLNKYKFVGGVLLIVIVLLNIGKKVIQRAQK